MSPVQPASLRQDPVRDAARARRRVLAVEVARLGLDQDDLVIHTQLRHVSMQMLAEVRPDLIIGPLIAADWDIVDLCHRISRCGYQGRILALTRPLPRADLVAGEVGALFPNLEFGLLHPA